MNQTRPLKTINQQKKPQTGVGFTTSRKRLRLPPQQFNPALITHTQPKQINIRTLVNGLPPNNTIEYYKALWQLHEAIHQTVTQEIERLETETKETKTKEAKHA